MENPKVKKQKKAILIIGVTAAVYLSFRFLLPLVIPFLIAWLLAALVRPITKWIYKKTHIRESISAGILLALLVAAFAVAGCILVKKVVDQATNLMDHLPLYLNYANSWVKICCTEIEKNFHMQPGRLVNTVFDLGARAQQQMQARMVPFLMENSVPVVKWFISAIVGLVIVFIAGILTVEDMDTFKKRKENSIFRMELTTIGNRLVEAGSAYFKVQLIIMLLTAILCTIGLWILGNPYPVLIGIGIGLFDALPIFGTGTVFIPWILIQLFQKNFVDAAGLSTIYLICYLMREVLEAKMMGANIGITALESLAAIYIGIELFGIAGILLGPAGFIIIREIVSLYG